MTYTNTLRALGNTTRSGRATRLETAGFTPTVADQLAARHDVVQVRVAETAAEMAGWQITVIA